MYGHSKRRLQQGRIFDALPGLPTKGCIFQCFFQGGLQHGGFLDAFLRACCRVCAIALPGQRRQVVGRGVDIIVAGFHNFGDVRHGFPTEIAVRVVEPQDLSDMRGSSATASKSKVG